MGIVRALSRLGSVGSGELDGRVEGDWRAAKEN